MPGRSCKVLHAEGRPAHELLQGCKTTPRHCALRHGLPAGQRAPAEEHSQGVRRGRGRQPDAARSAAALHAGLREDQRLPYHSTRHTKFKVQLQTLRCVLLNLPLHAGLQEDKQLPRHGASSFSKACSCLRRPLLGHSKVGPASHLLPCRQRHLRVPSSLPQGCSKRASEHITVLI